MRGGNDYIGPMNKPIRKTAVMRCPICGEATDVAFKPFCSKRCADIDLQRWFAGVYAVPSVENDAGPEEGEED